MLPDIISVEEEGRVKNQDAVPAANINEEFLGFGAGKDLMDQLFDLTSARDYLGHHGFSHGSLTQVRKERGISGMYAGYHARGEHRCDFCGKRIAGTEYDVMRDGRERCSECGRTVVVGPEALLRLFRETKLDYCEKFGVDLPENISVQVTSAQKIAKKQGKSFVPTPGFDVRSVGYAQYVNNGFVIVLENETPRMSLVSTIAHELTHIWQYSHWDLAGIRRTYKRYDTAVKEGMAVWVEAQYLYLINEKRHAEEYLAQSVARNDEYGFGLRVYLRQYSISRGVVLQGSIPFENIQRPVDLDLLDVESNEG